MKTQQAAAGQENTLLEVNVVPEEMDVVLPMTTTATHRGLVCLLRATGLVILGLVLGFILAMGINMLAGKQDPGQLSEPKEVDKKYATGDLRDISRDSSKYNIFTASKTARYNIYVRVRHQDKNEKEQHRVYLQTCWKKECSPTIPLRSEKDSYCTEGDVDLVLSKGSTVYLLFNEENDVPVVEKSVFHIFEINEH